ncbi:unnamed protein product [Scytosiphon promiscuus]
MATAGGAIHYVYANLWPLKFLAVAASLGGALFLPDPALFGVYAEIARVLSIVWMLFQGFLVLDFAHDIHDAIGVKADEQDSISGSSSSIFSSWWRIFYLVLSASCLVATGVGLTSIFTEYAGCTLGATLAGITVSVGVVTTVLSLVESVGIGLLPPSILFAHSTFLCWYALSSHPDSTCNPSASGDLLSAPAKTVGVTVSMCLLMSTFCFSSLALAACPRAVRCRRRRDCVLANRIGQPQHQLQRPLASVLLRRDGMCKCLRGDGHDLLGSDGRIPRVNWFSDNSHGKRVAEGRQPVDLPSTSDARLVGNLPRQQRQLGVPELLRRDGSVNAYRSSHGNIRESIESADRRAESLLQEPWP